MRMSLKGLVATATTALLLTSGAVPAGAVAGFGDVSEASYYAVPVQWMVDEDITTGVSPSCFDPDALVTRGQGVTFLWRLDGEKWAPKHSFSDISADWMRDAVDWAEDSGVTVGVGDGLFGPDLGLTRAQFVTMLWRYAGSPSVGSTAPFSDLTQDWYLDAVDWAAKADVTQGVGGGLFAPDRWLTRGEIATLLYRYADPSAPDLDSSSPSCNGGSEPDTSDPDPDPSPPDTSWVGNVEGPRGVLGPVSGVAVDPESVGVDWTGSLYSIPGGFEWDESSDGGYLLFDRGRVLIDGDGVSISGAVFDDLSSGGNSVVQAANGVGAFELRHFRVSGGEGSAAVGGSVGRGDGSVISNFEILDFDGDGMKPMTSSTVTDGFIHVTQEPGSELHYDGVQITGRSNVTLRRLRFRMEGTDNLNAAVFIHSNGGTAANNTTVSDIDIEYAAYVWFPVRIRSGSVDVSNIVGRGPRSADGDRPAALVSHKGQSGIDWDTIWVAFDGPVDQQRRI